MRRWCWYMWHNSWFSLFINYWSWCFQSIIIDHSPIRSNIFILILVAANILSLILVCSSCESTTSYIWAFLIVLNWWSKIWLHLSTETRFLVGNRVFTTVMVKILTGCLSTLSRKWGSFDLFMLYRSNSIRKLLAKTVNLLIVIIIVNIDLSVVCVPIPWKFFSKMALILRKLRAIYGMLFSNVRCSVIWGLWLGISTDRTEIMILSHFVFILAVTHTWFVVEQGSLCFTLDFKR